MFACRGQAEGAWWNEGKDQEGNRHDFMQMVVTVGEAALCLGAWGHMRLCGAEGEEVGECLLQIQVSEAWSKPGWQGWHLSKMQPTSATASA